MTTHELPPILSPEQLAELLQIPCDDKHQACLRRDGGLPYVSFRQGRKWFYRYPADMVMEWIRDRAKQKNGTL